jgi:nitrite reductase (NO-forming)
MTQPCFFKVCAIVFCLALLSTLPAWQPAQPGPLAESVKRGQSLYQLHCQSCHMENGEGIAGVFPPLAKADYLLKDPKRAMGEIIYGVSGEMVVNGVTYNGAMPANNLNNQEVADIMNYILNSWGNKGKLVKPADVQVARTQYKP